MTRVIAGSAGGRRLVVPSGSLTRPTSDRAREGLFSTLQSLIDLEGAAVLDLYAGSGALGLEALSRGAGRATLVDDDPRALAAMRTNAQELELPATVVEADVGRFLQGDVAPYDVLLLDPPYDVDVDPVLAALLPWVGPDAVVMVERRTRGPVPTPPRELRELRSRRYGEATLWYFSRS
ncbi:MAG: putative methylase [Frankiales bacterium]|jgi:16S rRNA (guanine966-N2)-methyltransferase|nr:putative methylase [Frankiales bacterium]MCW2586445.1 putative methylase [Frankiales bacterium]